jgi:hypothetical protein
VDDGRDNLALFNEAKRLRIAPSGEDRETVELRGPKPAKMAL